MVMSLIVEEYCHTSWSWALKAFTVLIPVKAALAYFVALLSFSFCASMAGVSPLEISHIKSAASGNVAIMTRVKFQE